MLENEGISFYYWQNFFNNAFRNRLSIILTLVKIIIRLRELNFNVIIPFQWVVIFSAIYPFTKAKVSFIHMIGGQIDKDKKLNKLEKLALYNKPIYVANSEHGRILLSKKWWIPLENIHKIHNRLFLRNIFDVDWEKYFNVKKHNFIAITLANYFLEKDFETLLSYSLLL